jgi:hypothetical protein
MLVGVRAKRIISVAAVAGAAVAATIGTGAAPAMAASGGGCSSWSASLYGVSVEGCINVSGFTVNADGWERGSGSSSCFIQFFLLNNNLEVVARSGVQSCSAGHHNGVSQVTFGTYYSEMCVFNRSPVAYVCKTSPAVNNP